MDEEADGPGRWGAGREAGAAAALAGPEGGAGVSQAGGGGRDRPGDFPGKAAFESHPECAAGALPRRERPALGFVPVPVAGAPGEDGAERSVRKLLQPLGRPAVAAGAPRCRPSRRGNTGGESGALRTV